MAETLLSPGVLTRENDLSLLVNSPAPVGAVIIGPTVKGQPNIPTQVTSWSEYLTKFGGSFVSGSTAEYTYFTSTAAYNYFQAGSTNLLVTRVASGSFSAATSSIYNGTLLTTASANFDVTYVSASVVAVGSGSFSINDIQFFFTGANATNTANIIYVNTSSFASSTATDYAFTASAVFNVSKSISPYNTLLSDITASNTTNTLNLTAGLVGGAYNYITLNNYTYISGSTTYNFSGATGVSALTIETISHGAIMNSAGSEDISGSLTNGTSDNIRWEIISPNTSSGTFNIVVRRGDDNNNNKVALETWTNLSLDPVAPNYISKVIGDSIYNLSNDSTYVEVTGSYPRRSNYIVVSSVNSPTPNYFDNNGIAKSAYTSSIPTAASGTFGSATGNLNNSSADKYYDAITDSNIQGLSATDYSTAITLLSSADEYQYNVITAPGLTYGSSNGRTQLLSLINNTRNRADAIAVIDTQLYTNGSVSGANTQANSIDNSYAATYWPWLQTVDPITGMLTWVPASTMIPAVYAFNDTVAAPWFAPAGINRGGLSDVVRAEKKLTQSDRDSLYQNKVNPIATFPNQGVVVYGQKTLQTQASALDRVNVRRLLIALKDRISTISKTLVFEQNTIATRNAFLSQVNPYLESVQQQQGLYAFKVVMDDSNNPADVIDRNQLVGAIYIQPTKTAEFIYLDFNILPTGATFPA